MRSLTIPDRPHRQHVCLGLFLLAHEAHKGKPSGVRPFVRRSLPHEAQVCGFWRMRWQALQTAPPSSRRPWALSGFPQRLQVSSLRVLGLHLLHAAILFRMPLGSILPPHRRQGFVSIAVVSSCEYYIIHHSRCQGRIRHGEDLSQLRGLVRDGGKMDDGMPSGGWLKTAWRARGTPPALTHRPMVGRPVPSPGHNAEGRNSNRALRARRSHRWRPRRPRASRATC